MDRDFRLTGAWREQTDNPIAPVGFEVNNPWRVCRILLSGSINAKLRPDGEKDCLMLDTFATFTVHILSAGVAYAPPHARQNFLCNDFLSLDAHDAGVLVATASRPLPWLLDLRREALNTSDLVWTQLHTKVNLHYLDPLLLRLASHQYI